MPWKNREVQIIDDESVGDSGTLTVDLNVRDPITALIIRFKVKNGAAAFLNNPPEINISKVEIVDGGQTIYSLNGPMAVAAAVYGLGRWPHHWYDERADSNQRINFPLLFGRYLGDEEFAFDPSRLLNPQLKITWVDYAGYLNNNHTIGVTARLMEGLPSPSNCLVWQEVEAWNTAGSGEHRVDLPVNHPIRSLLMRPYVTGDLPTTVWTDFKLDCDVGKFIPFDLASHEFRDVIKQTDGPFRHRQFVWGTQAIARQAWFGETINALATSSEAVSFCFSWTAFWSFYNLSITHNDGTDRDSIAAQVTLDGLFPHSCYLYRFGRKDSPETWFPAREYGEVALKIGEGSADAAASVAIQYPRRIP